MKDFDISNMGESHMAAGKHFVSWYDNRSIMNWSEEHARILQQKPKASQKAEKQ